MSNRELLAEKGNVKIFAVQDNYAENPWSSDFQDLPFEYHLETRNFKMKSKDFTLGNADYWYEPIYAYTHSGMTVSTTPFSCRWDSGVLGYVAAKRPSRGGEFKRRASFRAALDSYVKVLDDYLQGDCFGYEVEIDGEVTDSCWGFIGSDHTASGLMDYVQGYL